MHDGFKDEAAPSACERAGQEARQMARNNDDHPRHDRSGRRSRNAGGKPQRPGLRLSETLSNPQFVACDDVLAKGCYDNPRACGPGDVFVARSDDQRDGHELISEAVARGCSGVVAERLVPTFGAPLCLVSDAAAAYTRIVHSLAGNPAQALDLVAITGTSGKTTTSWLTAAVLSEAGHSVGVLSDLGCLDAGSIEAEPPAKLSDPHIMVEWLKRLIASGCSHAVLEVSSEMLAAQALAGLSCGTVAVTNLASAHLDRHGSVEAYHAVKQRILSSLPSTGCFVGNADDPNVLAMASHLHDSRQGHVRQLLAGLRTTADLTASPVERGLNGQTFLLRTGREMMPVAVSTPVASYARNALVAAAVGIAHGASLATIARGLEAVSSVTGRLERLDRGQDFACFVDQPTSGHQLASTLASLRHLTGHGRLVAAVDIDVADALEGLGRRQRFGSRLLRWCDDCILIPNRLSRKATDHSTRFLAGFDRALSQLQKGDCLVVVGHPGWDEDPTDPAGERMSAQMLAEGWFRVACPPEWTPDWRRAA
jgi:UDP-N-acetylmuramoyl-L-alanyl-D-glutamate--2,6-diaminopimelate ligase